MTYGSNNVKTSGKFWEHKVDEIESEKYKAIAVCYDLISPYFR